MKNLLRAVMLLSVVGSNCLFANSSEFRSPRRVIRGVMHYPLVNVEDAWWYDTMPETGDPEKTWQLETWAAGWRMQADSAFDAREKGSTSETTSLSQLWFGKDAFRGEEIFVGGMINDPALLTFTNPFLGFARITPRFNYVEHGVVAGLYFRQTFGEDDCWHFGFRASLPVLEIEIEQNAGCALEETLDDVVRRIPTNLDGDADQNQVDYAYRLDLLTSLSRPTIPEVNTVPMVQFGDGTGDVLTSTFIGTTSVSALTPEGMVFPDGSAYPAAYVIRANGADLAESLAAACGDCVNVCDGNSEDNFLFTGQVPPYPFRKTASQVTGQLQADGSGGRDGSVLFFQLEGQDYSSALALDRDAQTELFVVPRKREDADIIFANAVVIDESVQSILQFLDPAETASVFFLSKGIDLCAHDSTVGVGDMYTELSVGYGNYHDWFGDFLLGFVFPTGTAEGPANEIFHKPTGNNHHFEIRLGLEGGWQPCEWFGLRGDASYFHAFKAKECRAIPFNQTRKVLPPVPNDCNCPCVEQFFVKNIGEGMELDISWDYFVGHIDFTFFHPFNPEIGAVIGYELMAKSKDHVSLGCDSECDSHGTVTATRTDLLGRTNQLLNVEVLEQNTNAMTHKIYGDVFHRWNYFELFAGASQIVGGKHAMQETEAHLGMKIFF